MRERRVDLYLLSPLAELLHSQGRVTLSCRVDTRNNGGMEYLTEPRDEETEQLILEILRILNRW